MIKFVGWDWKSAPALVDLKNAIEAFPSGPLYVHEVETGIDETMIAISNEHLDRVDVARAYRQWVGLDEPTA